MGEIRDKAREHGVRYDRLWRRVKLRGLSVDEAVRDIELSNRDWLARKLRRERRLGKVFGHFC